MRTNASFRAPLVSALVLTAWLGGASHAGANLVTNGNFTSLSGTKAAPNYFVGYGWTELNGWTYSSAPAPNAALYTFPGADNSTGACRPGGCFPLYGPHNGYNNGFGPPPGGGNFLASDATDFQGSFSQTIDGLIPGKKYQLSFVWGGNEYLDSSSLGATGQFSVDWEVFLGPSLSPGESPLVTTPDATYDAHGFSGWKTETFDFTYTGSSTPQLLSFLAQGTPAGVPAVALLDGVSLTAVPEPSSWVLMLAGFAGVGAVGYRAARRKAALAG